MLQKAPIKDLETRNAKLVASNAKLAGENGGLRLKVEELESTQHDMHCSALSSKPRYSPGCSCGNIKRIERLNELHTKHQALVEAARAMVADLEDPHAVWAKSIVLCDRLKAAILEGEGDDGTL